MSTSTRSTGTDPPEAPLPGTDPVIVLEAVSVGYGAHPVVREVDLTVHRHEVVALVGPNGSGKTTLVRGVLGLAPVLSGTVRLFGTPSGSFHQRYRMGYVPQRHTVGGGIPSTVQEVVASGRLPRKRWFSRTGRADREAIAEAVATVGLGDHRSTPVSFLSGGQQRRVLIARALASEPEVLVMDEPTAGVDAAHQERLTDTLGDLVRRGLTLLIITHDIRPLLPILTRVVALDGGRIVLDTPAADLAERRPPCPGDDLVAALAAGLDTTHEHGHPVTDSRHHAPEAEGISLAPGSAGPGLLPGADLPGPSRSPGPGRRS